MPLKIIFMGTPEFGVPTLRELIKHYDVRAVFTQPDRPKGRGQKVQISPIKEVALEYNIDIYQPEKLRNDKECLNAIKEISPDIIIVIAYGQILPVEVLELPRLGCINLHASLLPKLRGAAPITWAIINGDRVAGNTTMYMAAGIDTGDMLLKQELEIAEDETAQTLHDRLSTAGVDLMLRTIEGLNNNSIIPEKQQDELSSHVSKLTKELGHIDWTKDCNSVDCLIRGVSPWPGAYMIYDEKIIKILKAKKGSSKEFDNAGQIVNVDKNGIEISCGKGTIIITQLQEHGGKSMDIAAYLNGHKINKGDIVD